MRPLFLILVLSSVQLAMEVLGARRLAPFIGSSDLVWGNLLIVTLILSGVGALIGARINESRLSVAVIGCALGFAVSNFALPFLCTAAVSEFLIEPFDSLWAAFLLLGLGNFAWGLSFNLAQRQALGLHDHRKMLSWMTLSGGFGCLIGVYVTNFVFLANDNFGVSRGIYAWTFILLIGGLLVSFSTKTRASVATALIIVSLFFLRDHFPNTWKNMSVADYRVSRYRDFLIAETPRRRFLVQPAQGMIQGGWVRASADRPWSVPEGLLFLSDLPLDPTFKPSRVLVVGLGAGLIPARLNELYGPGLDADVVEIDPVVISLARTYFNVPAETHVFQGDARRYIQLNTKTYDLIYLDAFGDGVEPPSHLMTKEFYALVSRHLTSNGRVIMNTFGPPLGPYSRPVWSTYATLRSIFKTVRAYSDADLKTPKEKVFSNFFFAASNGSLDSLTARPRVSEEHIPQNALVLTDEFNPVRHWAMKRLEHEVL